MMRSLRLRMAVGACLAIGVALLLVWYSLNQFFSSYVLDSTFQELTVLSDNIAANVVWDGKALTIDNAPKDPRLSLPAGGRYWQISQGDTILLRSRSLWDQAISKASLKADDDSRFWRAEGPDGQPILVLASPIKLEDGDKAKSFEIYTALPQKEPDDARAAFKAQTRAMLLLTAIMLVFAALLQSLLGLRPLDHLRTSIAEIRSGIRSDLGDEGPSEVSPLVREINLLLAERATAVERARARASDLAHGLKTPLTVLTQLAEGLKVQDRIIALQQVDLIRQRSDRQLQAARLGVEQMASTRVGDIAGKLAQVLRPLIESRNLTLSLQVPDTLLVNADPADLAEAFGNILENAVKWARSSILVTGLEKDGMISVTISDDGPGIEESALSDVFTRGVHSPDSEGGSGLGLAISSDIVRAYHGTVELTRSTAGGLAVTLKFPAKMTLVKVSTPF